jgi:hypothetical protein
MSSINFIYLNNTVIREHRAVLRRDDIAQQRGSVRRHGGKPAYVYGLTSEAEDLFPKTYERVLGRLLDVLAQRLGPEESEALLRSLGRSFGSDKEQTNESFNRSGKSSCFVGFDPFRGIPNKKSIRVEWEHYVQGATRILFSRHLEGPQDAIGLHE